MKMKFQYKQIAAIAAIVMIIGFFSCNKDVPDPVPITQSDPKGNSIADLLNAPEYSILKAAVTRAGMLTALSNKTGTFTLFAPKNDAFIASGIPNETVIGLLPQSTVTALVQYHIIPGLKLGTGDISENYPNVELPTAFTFPAPNTIPFVKFTTYPSRRGSNVWVNNIPIIGKDIEAANGIMHNPPVLIAPPTRVLLDTLSRDPEMRYLLAAVARADSGRAAGTKFADYLANPLYSLTIFAPNNQAFQNLLAAYGLPPDPAAFNFIPVATMQGLLGYHVHILSGTPPPAFSVKFSRAFSVNFPATPTPISTFLATVINPAPPIIISSDLGVKGLANATFSNIVAKDRHAVNGVYHIIDQVLRPQ
ncbi:fasciclin domain-containing protein [Pollutibacter soli]|uniref:fasciclin domain-containing protein n=1 Tax=Pollutibacter soli TaxID=3034157 RepID=UPI0030139752